jgi:hypothetical protein
MQAVSGIVSLLFFVVTFGIVSSPAFQTLDHDSRVVWEFATGG